MENKPFGTGAIHTIDERDRPYIAGGAIPEILPTTYQTENPFSVLMQALQEACVSHSAARNLQLYWYKKTGKMIDFSPRFLHAYTSKGTQPTDGRDPRTIFQVLTDIGCCTEALLPNDVNLDLSTYSYAPITQAMLDEASQYKIPAYEFVNIDSYDLRHAIYHKGSVSLLFKIGSEWWTAADGRESYAPADINPLRAPVAPVGGHEVTGEHWTTIEGIENSWSIAWNEKGFGEYNLANYQPYQAICINDPLVDFNPIAQPTPNPIPVTKYNFTIPIIYGSTSNDVINLQELLNMPLSLQSGYYGFLTLCFVVKFQVINKLPISSTVSLQFLNLL